MAKSPGVDLNMEAAEGGLKELVLRWFTETQAPLIMHNGNFPDWFQGLAARKDAEDLLKDKALGSFLIRLSDKAIGYILSYKGHDRCRHFVITQNQEGQFVIAGDCQLFGSLTELIEHYKVSPIQPFGECLISSCHEEDAGEVYDVVNATKSGVSVQALRNIWDHKIDHQREAGNNQRIQHQNESPRTQPLVLPLKSRNRKLTGTVSVDAASLSQGVPPVPKRGIPLGFTLSGSFPETMPHPSETTTDSNRAERLRGSTALTSNTDSFNTTDTNNPANLCPSGAMYSELNHVESRSKSLPKLDNSDMEEELYSKKSSSPSSTASTPQKRVTCQTYSLYAPSEGLNSSRSEQPSNDQDLLKSNPLYQSSETPGGSSALQGGGMYAEVPQGQMPAGLSEETYEQIPVQSNTYESLEDLKTKKSKSTWGTNNLIWKKFLPDYMKK